MKETCGRGRRDCSPWNHWCWMSTKSVSSNNAQAALAMCVTPLVKLLPTCPWLRAVLGQVWEYLTWEFPPTPHSSIVSQPVWNLLSSWPSLSRNKLYNLIVNQKENYSPLTILKKYISNKKPSYQTFVYYCQNSQVSLHWGCKNPHSFSSIYSEDFPMLLIIPSVCHS